MKILVVYDSRHGFTERCLDLLAAELPPGLDLWPLRRRPGVPVWSSYDAVVFGGPVYFGRWSPRLTAFLQRHTQSLLSVGRLGAFVVSLSTRVSALRYFSKGLPGALKGRLGRVACFGGGVTWKALSWWERALLHRGRGIDTDAGNLNLNEIQALAEWLSANGPGA